MMQADDPRNLDPELAVGPSRLQRLLRMMKTRRFWLIALLIGIPGFWVNYNVWIYYKVSTRVRVGMRYDEVEAILGKPWIERKHTWTPGGTSRIWYYGHTKIAIRGSVVGYEFVILENPNSEPADEGALRIEREFERRPGSKAQAP